jgi:hypothetical protein
VQQQQQQQQQVSPGPAIVRFAVPLLPQLLKSVNVSSRSVSLAGVLSAPGWPS